MPKNPVSSTVLKLAASPSFLADFHHTNGLFNRSVREVMGRLLVLSGEEYTLQIGENRIVRSTEQVRGDQLRIRNREISQANAIPFHEVCRLVYDGSMYNGGRAIACAFFGGSCSGEGKEFPEIPEVIKVEKGDPVEKIEQARERNLEILRAKYQQTTVATYWLRQMGLLPVANRFPKAKGFLYAVMSQAVAKLKSREEVQKARYAEAAGLAKGLDAYKAEINFAALKPYYELFEQFADLMEQDYQQSTKESRTNKIRHHFNLRRFIKKKWPRIRQSLKSNKDISEPEYKALIDSQYRVLWDNPAGVDYIGMMAHITLQERKISRLREPVAISLPDLDHCRALADIPYEKNFYSFDLAKRGDELVLMLPLLNRKGDLIKHEVGLMRNEHFRFTKIEHDRVWNVQFLRGGRLNIETSGVLKQIFVHYAKKKHGEGVYVVLPINVSRETTDDQQRNRELANRFFFSATSTKQTVDLPVRLRALSIDLNKTPLLAYAVGELSDSATPESFSVANSGNQFANILDVGKRGNRVDNKFCSQTEGFTREIKRIRQLIAFANKVKVDDIDLDSFNPFTELGIEPILDQGQLEREIASRITTLKRFYNETKSNHSRNRQVGISADSLIWAFFVDAFISLLCTWTIYHFKDKDQSGRQLCAEHRRYLRNLKADLLKKIAHEVEKLCREHKIDIVVLEDLGYFKTSLDRDSELNYFLKLWTPRGIKTAIESQLRILGICVNEVDPRHSSQLDPWTGRFGRRGDRYGKKMWNKERLYVEREDGPVWIDSDIAAALNLQRRFWGRHSEISCVRCRRANNGDLVYVGASKRVFAALGRKPVFSRNGTGYLLGQGLQKPKLGKVVKLYRHGDRWFEEDDHREQVAQIAKAGAEQLNTRLLKSCEESDKLDAGQGCAEPDELRHQSTSL